MDDSDKKEIIKLLVDWNKWLVGVETIAISALGLIFKERDGVSHVAIGCASASLVFFLVSIFLSSMLLLNLPFMAGNSKDLNADSFQHNEIYFESKEQDITRKRWTIGSYTSNITRTFGFGLFLFVLALITGFYLDA
ncbi:MULTISPECIES: hypothetical protein [unclassified Ketobacter]|uniref:hypothetical protein n=1 Tax=unclassified Ketobacter TaxID=2639109 RepID=UPI000F1C9BD1|nr:MULTISPECIES: hypothetical protein [unclassified Ketobacter]RLT89423.1 MAG: hypothetical protein D9N13_14030 [Ketobacter sp. GenoA1]RLT95730.1 MAG: hypothetical protein D9N15_12820 [Ketobacter sp.]